MIITLIGVPASGKSSIVKAIINTQPENKWATKKFKKLRFMVNSSLKLVVFGLYPKEGTFVGTDMLSMDIMQDAQDFLRKFLRKYNDYSILIEGDRFNNSVFFNHLREMDYDHKIYNLYASPSTLEYRHNTRNNTQSERWLRTCNTKVGNTIANFNVETLVNNTEREQNQNIGIIKHELGISPKTKLR